MKKFNFIDILIVLAVIFIIVVAFSYMSGKNPVSLNSKIINYNMLVEDISLETASQMKVGDTVFNSVNGMPIGVIKKIKVSEYEEDFFDKDTGEYKKVIKTEHYTVDMILENEAEKREELYYIGELKISVGTGAYLRGQNYVCRGKILGITEVIGDEK